jgi:hypothetical protein
MATKDPRSLCDLLRENAKKSADEALGKKLVKVQQFADMLTYLKATVPETVEVSPVLGYSTGAGEPPVVITVDTLTSAADARVLIADMARALPDWVMATICGCDTTDYNDKRGQTVANFVSTDDTRMEVKVRYAPVE